MKAGSHNDLCVCRVGCGRGSLVSVLERSLFLIIAINKQFIVSTWAIEKTDYKLVGLEIVTYRVYIIHLQILIFVFIYTLLAYHSFLKDWSLEKDPCLFFFLISISLNESVHVCFCRYIYISVKSVQSLSRVQLFVTPWTEARQASLSITNSWSSLKFMFIESVMSSNHLILCRPFLLLPSIFPSNQALFKSVSSFHQVAKVLEFQLQPQSFQWIFRTDFL